MKHHAFATAMGLLIAAALVPASQAEAASASPTGIWRKADPGERPGKFEITWCGRSNKLLCAKIVWLQEPNDSKGRPLHDVRNENPGMRDRPILGLPIFSGLQPVGPNVWKGNIYNPEDGGTYSVTVTQVSRNQIHVKGCKAWLLCGERTWLRSSLPKEETEPEAAPETQIEAATEPEAPVEQASVAPEEQAQEPAEQSAMSEAEILTPATEEGTRPGYRFLNASTGAETPAGLSGENVPSMFLMTKPIADDEAEEPAEAPASATMSAPAPAPEPAAEEPAPAPQSATATAAATPRPKPAPSAPAVQAAAPPADPQADAVETAETETAETAVLEEPSLTRRQRRLLRRQQQQPPQGLLPWLR